MSELSQEVIDEILQRIDDVEKGKEKPFTISELMTKLEDTSGDLLNPSGRGSAPYLLFSGSTPNGKNAWEIADEIRQSKNGNKRVNKRVRALKNLIKIA